MPQQLTGKIYRRKLIMLSAIVMTLCGIVILLPYLLPINPATLAVLRVFHLPVGKVDKSFVTIQDIEHAGNPPAVRVSAFDFEQQFKSYANIAASGKLIRAYNISMQNSNELNEEEKLIRIKTWWNSREQLNTRGWQKLKIVKAGLSRDDNFALAARAYSEDPATKDFDGDAGFIDNKQLLPEYRDKLLTMKEGDRQIIASRHGLHLVNLLNIAKDDTGVTRYHIQEIFIASEGFEEWYRNQVVQVKSSLYIR